MRERRAERISRSWGLVSRRRNRPRRGTAQPRPRASLAPVGEEGVDDHHGASEQDRSERCRQDRPSQGGCRDQHRRRPGRHGGCERHRGTLPRLVRVGDHDEDLQTGLSSGQPTAYAANRIRERVVGLDARQAKATPAPRITAPGRTFTTAPPVRLLAHLFDGHADDAPRQSRSRACASTILPAACRPLSPETGDPGATTRAAIVSTVGPPASSSQAELGTRQRSETCQRTRAQTRARPTSPPA